MKYTWESFPESVVKVHTPFESEPPPTKGALLLYSGGKGDTRKCKWALKSYDFHHHGLWSTTGRVDGVPMGGHQLLRM